jgi:hypothetical protein
MRRHGLRDARRFPSIVGAALMVSTTAALGLVLTAAPVTARDCTINQWGLCVGGTGSGNPSASTSAEPGSGGTDPQACHDQGGGVVPCTDGSGGVWFGAPHYCYGYKEDPQPVASDPVWSHNNITPADGAFWECSTGPDAGEVWWIASGQTTVDPAQVAKTLEDRAAFVTANAHIAPPPTFHTYVHYMNWLWIDPDQWKDIAVSVSVGGATIGLTASPKNTRWNMGNGDVITCDGPGRVWQEGLADNSSTSCSYAYNHLQHPTGDQWTVSAQVTYGIRWTCQGACGGQTSGDLADVTANAGAATSTTVYQRRTVITR